MACQNSMIAVQSAINYHAIICEMFIQSADNLNANNNLRPRVHG
jgi:hypothetical protein